MSGSQYDDTPPGYQDPSSAGSQMPYYAHARTYSDDIARDADRSEMQDVAMGEADDGFAQMGAQLAQYNNQGDQVMADAETMAGAQQSDQRSGDQHIVNQGVGLGHTVQQHHGPQNMPPAHLGLQNNPSFHTHAAIGQFNHPANPPPPQGAGQTTAQGYNTQFNYFNQQQPQGYGYGHPQQQQGYGMAPSGYGTSGPAYPLQMTHGFGYGTAPLNTLAPTNQGRSSLIRKRGYSGDKEDPTAANAVDFGTSAPLLPGQGQSFGTAGVQRGNPVTGMQQPTPLPRPSNPQSQQTPDTEPRGRPLTRTQPYVRGQGAFGVRPAAARAPPPRTPPPRAETGPRRPRAPTPESRRAPSPEVPSAPRRQRRGRHSQGEIEEFQRSPSRTPRRPTYQAYQTPQQLNEGLLQRLTDSELRRRQGGPLPHAQRTPQGLTQPVFGAPQGQVRRDSQQEPQQAAEDDSEQPRKRQRREGPSELGDLQIGRAQIGEAGADFAPVQSGRPFFHGLSKNFEAPDAFAQGKSAGFLPMAPIFSAPKVPAELPSSSSPAAEAVSSPAAQTFSSSPAESSLQIRKGSDDPASKTKHKRKTSERLSFEAAKRGADFIDLTGAGSGIPEKPEELHSAGHATAAGPAYTAEMEAIRRNSTNAFERSAAQGRVEAVRVEESSVAGAASATSRLSARGEERVPAGFDARLQPAMAAPERTVAPLEAFWGEFAVAVGPRVDHRAISALRNGVSIYDIENGTVIRDAMDSFIVNHRRRLQDSMPSSRVLRETANNPIHMESLGLPVPFDITKVMEKVRANDYDMSFNEVRDVEISEETRAMCTVDPDGSLRAPEVEFDEMRADLEFMLTQAEEGDINVNHDDVTFEVPTSAEMQRDPALLRIDQRVRTAADRVDELLGRVVYNDWVEDWVVEDCYPEGGQPGRPHADAPDGLNDDNVFG